MYNLCNVQWLSVLKDINCQLDAGRFYALVGPNGSGKSSLLAMLAGTKQPSHGMVQLNDCSLAKQSLAQIATQRAVMPQKVELNFPMPVREVVQLGNICQQHQHAELVAQCLALVGMSEHIDQPYSRLSGGQQQRVQLARVLCQLGPLEQAKGKWLLLDEATASLDLQYQHQVFALSKYLADIGLGVISVVHDVNLAAKYADEVLVLKDGRLIEQGSVAQVIQHQLADALYGLPAATLFDSQHSPVIAVERQQMAG